MTRTVTSTRSKQLRHRYREVPSGPRNDNQPKMEALCKSRGRRGRAILANHIHQSNQLSTLRCRVTAYLSLSLSPMALLIGRGCRVRIMSISKIPRQHKNSTNNNLRLIQACSQCILNPIKVEAMVNLAIPIPPPSRLSRTISLNLCFTCRR